MKRTGGARWIRGKPYARVRIGKGRRVTVALPGVSSAEEADERARQIASVAELLVEAGRWFDVEDVARAMGAAKTERELRVLCKAAERMAAQGPKLIDGEDDFLTFAGRWTSGALAKLYPDHVKVKDHRGDIGIINLYLKDLIGRIPLRAFTLEHADSVMASLPSDIGKARRRHVAQVIHRVLALAVYPAKIIPASPLPKGWLPKLDKPKAFAYLYPKEDEQLLGHTAIPLDIRMLYGVLTREGLRVSEALALEWTDLDLEVGHIDLDENKTDDPRGWTLDKGVVRALAAFKRIVGGDGPFKDIPRGHLAERLRGDLTAAGVKRAKLHERSEKRQPLRVHDLRATFVTLSLANGKTETWVADRTGHTSSAMIARYRRVARGAEELNLGPLKPLDEVIPELSGGAQVGHGGGPIVVHRKRGKRRILKEVAPEGLEPSRPVRARDFKSLGSRATGKKPRENGRSPRAKTPLAGAAPQGAPHPSHGTWRDVADAFDDVVLALDREVGKGAGR